MARPGLFGGERSTARLPVSSSSRRSPASLPFILTLGRHSVARPVAAIYARFFTAIHSYLIDEFLQSKTNRRDDRYGGSLENRFRFLREIVEAIAAVWPSHRIGVRLSPNGVYNDMGSPDFRATFLYAAEPLDAYGLGYLHVMDGLAFGFHGLGEPLTLAEIRAVYRGQLIGNCGYERDSAEAALARGEADLIAFGRPFISNPDLVDRFTHGWPLAEPAPMSVWYTPGAEGYTDFPAYSPV